MFKRLLFLVLLLGLTACVCVPAHAEATQVLIVATEDGEAAFAVHVELNVEEQRFVLTHLGGDDSVAGKSAAAWYASGSADDLAEALSPGLTTDYTAVLRLANIARIVDLIGGAPLRLTAEELADYGMAGEGGVRNVDGATLTAFLQDALQGPKDQRQRARQAATSLAQKLFQLPLDQLLGLLPQVFESLQTNMPLNAMTGMARDASALREAPVIVQSYSGK